MTILKADTDGSRILVLRILDNAPSGMSKHGICCLLARSVVAVSQDLRWLREQGLVSVDSRGANTLWDITTKGAVELLYLDRRIPKTGPQ